VLSSSRWAQASSSSRTLLPLGARVVKVMVFAIALVGLLSLLGYPVAGSVGRAWPWRVSAGAGRAEDARKLVSAHFQLASINRSAKVIS